MAPRWNRCPNTLPTGPRSDWLTGGLAVLDPGGRIVSVNEPLARWLGETPGTLAGRPWQSILTHRCADWEDPVG